MTATKIEFKSAIETEIIKTEGKLVEYRDMAAPVSPDNAIGRISRMDAINNKSISEVAVKQAEQKLAGLKQLLSKIDDAEFGLCAKCHQPIPYGRLLMVPQSRFCMGCVR